MLEFLIDKMFLSFGGTLFQQAVGIPIGTNCAPLLADSAYIWKIYDFKIEIVPFIINFSIEYTSKNDADEAVSMVSLTSSSGGYINGRNYVNLELLIDKTSSIYLYVKLKALAS
jgi:hypothetical protein